MSIVCFFYDLLMFGQNREHFTFILRDRTFFIDNSKFCENVGKLENLIFFLKLCGSPCFYLVV